MQLYFPNFKTPQGAIAIFEYIRASKIQQESNVIFNSDLNLDDRSNIPGGTGPIENYPNNDTNLFSFLSYVVANWRESTSQVFQDLYVRWKLNNCSKGVFIDIGAGDPVMGNNTLYFEKKLKWSGFLLEPDLRLHKKIEQFRKSPLEKAPLHTENNKKIIFYYDNRGGVASESATVTNKKFSGSLKSIDINDFTELFTITTFDFLTKHSIPKDISYLSLDTFGGVIDIDILKTLIENDYMPSVITRGHNYFDNRPEVHEYLTSVGYIREFDFLSQWDDWYYLPKKIQS